MKIYYFNDRHPHAFVYINDFNGPFKLLVSQTGDYFEIDLKENQIPFIKVWEAGNVLISGIDYEKSKI